MAVPAELETYSSAAKQWMLAHGMLMAKPGTGGNGELPVLSHAPFTLHPSKFPRAEFKKACALQREINLMVDKVANDVEFLNETLKSMAVADEFMSKLLDILNTVQGEGLAQPTRLGLLRSDYMLDSDESEGGRGAIASAKIKQVEVNTISVSFGSLGNFVSQLHSYMNQRYRTDVTRDLPINRSLSGLAHGLACAWRHYGNENAVAMMVVLPEEHNTFDQCWLEYTLWEEHGIAMVRHSLEDVAQRGVLDANSKALIIDGKEIAVAYYRAGYVPEHYTSSSCWDARLLIERSLAIKCPDVGYHLAGAKKVQQVLVDAALLERFVPAAVVPSMLSVFTGLYPVEVGSKVVEDAIAHPHKYVLKPQREGGGHNLYTDQLKETLSKATDADCKQYILMDRISPPSQPGYIIRDSRTVAADMVGELGVFGIILSTNGSAITNEHVGHLLRSKPLGVDDGGVAAGVAVLDSPDLA